MDKKNNIFYYGVNLNYKLHPQIKKKGFPNSGVKLHRKLHPQIKKIYFLCRVKKIKLRKKQSNDNAAYLRQGALGVMRLPLAQQVPLSRLSQTNRFLVTLILGGDSLIIIVVNFTAIKQTPHFHRAPFGGARSAQKSPSRQS